MFDELHALLLAQKNRWVGHTKAFLLYLNSLMFQSRAKRKRGWLYNDKKAGVLPIPRKTMCTVIYA